MHSSLLSPWQKLEEMGRNLENSILSSSPPQQQFKSSPEAWNMLQVLQHIVAIEKASIEYLVTRSLRKERKKAGVLDQLRAFLLRIFLKSPLKFKVPPVEGIRPTKEVDKEDLVKVWKHFRQQLKAFLENYPDQRLEELIFRHPVAGWLTLEQTLYFFADHIQHHQQQLLRIRKNPDFPAY